MGPRARRRRALAGSDHVELLRSAAWCRHTEGDTDRAEALLRAAVAEVDETADPPRMAAVLERLARQQWRLGPAERRVGRRSSARSRCSAGEPTERARDDLTGRPST